MKFKFRYLIIAIFALFIGIGSINAQTMNTADIENNTYVIGTHVFTRNTNDNYNGELTIQLIMLAARTIEGNSLDDMVIYYKNARGKWINGVTGDAVTMPATVSIQFVDTEATLSVPELIVEAEGSELNEETGVAYNGKGIATAESMKIELSCKQDAGQYIVEGEFLFNNKIGESYYYENGSLLIEVPEGHSKTCRARSVVEVNGSKRYSGYSNEIVVEGPEVKVPELIGIDAIGGRIDENTGVSYNTRLLGTQELMKIELSCKEDAGQYSILGEYLFNTSADFDSVTGYIYGSEGIIVEVAEGHTKTCRARKVNQIGNTTEYSDYSNEIVVEGPEVKVPELIGIDAIGGRIDENTGVSYNTRLLGTQELMKIELSCKEDAGQYSILGEYLFNTSADFDSVTGYIYGSEGIIVEVAEGHTKTCRARKVNQIGNTKEYSDYSEEITISYLLGDTNGNGVVNIEDALRLREYLADNSVSINYSVADVDEDGEVDDVDYEFLSKYYDNISYIASVYKYPKYTITYDLAGGTANDYNPTKYAKVSDYSFKLNAPVKDNYFFAGWTGSNGTTPQYNVTIKDLTGDVNYTANWEQNILPQYTISDNPILKNGKYEYTITINNSTAIKESEYFFTFVAYEIDEYGRHVIGSSPDSQFTIELSPGESIDLSVGVEYKLIDYINNPDVSMTDVVTITAPSE